jgi:hypothetical protein
MPSTAELARDLRHALDPVAFARDRLGFEADEWQTGLLRSSARWVLVNCSRQAGKSTTAGVLALHVALHKPGALILLVAPSLRQASELFRKFAAMRGRLDPAPALSEDNAFSCTFAGTGSRVLSLPGSEATVRGFSAPTLIVEDEAARVPDDLYRAVRPMLATAPTGRLILMSTPAGQVGHFWNEWSEGGPDWHRVMVPADQVPRIDPAFLAAERRALGDAWYRQEYMTEFLQATNQVFRPEDVARMVSVEIEPLFPTAPVAGDPLPLFPRGVPVPPRSP